MIAVFSFTTDNIESLKVGQNSEVARNTAKIMEYDIVI